MSTPAETKPFPADLGMLWRHRALVITAAYAFIALVGALYHALLLGDFGLNPFRYWEASDLLLAAFREPLALAFGATAVLIYVAFVDPIAVNDRFYRRGSWFAGLIRYERWRESRWAAPRIGPLAATVLTLSWFVLVMGGFAAGAASEARRGAGQPVRFVDETGAMRDAQLLTTSNRFAFLVVPGDEPRLLVVPFDQLARLEHCGARQGGLSALLRGARSCADPAVAPPATPPATPPTASVAPP